jgi:hypothetical protein
MRHLRRGLPLVGVAALFAAPAYADAGTAMMWLIPGHLLIGNAIIGLCEYAVLMHLLRKRRHPDAGYSPWDPFTMVFANYVSAWAGVWLLATGWREVIRWLYPEPLYHTGSVVAVSWLALFVLSVVAEWPLVAWAMERITRERPGWLGSLRGSLAVNVASYIPLTLLYALVCPVTLPTQAKVDPSLSFARGVPAKVYYVADDGKVWSVRPDGSEREQLEAPPLKAKYPQLVLVRNPKTSALDLYGEAYDRSRGFVRIARGVGKVPVFPDAPPDGSGHPARPLYEGNSGNWRSTDLRSPRLTGTYVSLGTWAVEGVSWKNSVDRSAPRLLHLAVETPFMALSAKDGTLVGNDLLIFEYDSAFNSKYHRIVALDLPSRRIGVLASGSSPVVVLDELPEGAHWWKSPSKEPLHSSFLESQVEKDKP